MIAHPEMLPPSQSAVAHAAALVRSGRLVAVPTETVYLALADATSDEAVEALFAARSPERLEPLAILVSDADEARRIGEFTETADLAASAFWPGPLTLVVPLRPDALISPFVTPGTDRVFLRVPGHPVVRAVMRAVGRPLASAAACRPTTLPPTSPLHAAHDLGDRLAFILAGGKTSIGLESTRVEIAPEGARLLRPGPVSQGDLGAVLGPLPVDGREPPVARLTHLPLRLEAVTVEPGEALLAFGPDQLLRTAGPRANLSEAGDLHEAAANLYAMLRQLDRSPQTAIAVMPIPDQGLGQIINQRLRHLAGLRAGS